MQITSTTLRRIIKEELDAVINEADAFQAAKDEEDRAATAAGAAAFQEAELSEARPAGNAPRNEYIGKKVKKDGKSGRVVAMRNGDYGRELSIKFDDPELGVVRTLASSSDLEFLK